MSIGGTLAEARQAAGLSVGDVSARTRIRAALIRAIEADDFAPCGGDFYARGHIRAIARVVGVDSRPLIADYDAVLQEPPPGALEDLLAPPPEEDPSGDPAEAPSATPLAARFGWRGPRPRHARDPARPREPARRPVLPVSWPSWIPRPAALLALIALAVIVGGTYQLAAGGPAPRAGATASRGASQGDNAAAAGPAPRRESPSPAATPPATRASPPPSPVTVRQVKPSDAAAVGPGGDGGDNPDLAARALAGDASSPWHTHWYTTAAFGNLQDGTGLLLTLPRAVTVTGVTVKFGDSGGAMQVKAGPSPGSLRTMASGSAGGTAHLSFDRTSARYIELWFTRLGTDNGANQISVYGVTVSALEST